MGILRPGCVVLLQEALKVELHDRTLLGRRRLGARVGRFEIPIDPVVDHPGLIDVTVLIMGVGVLIAERRRCLDGDVIAAGLRRELEGGVPEHGRIRLLAVGLFESLSELLELGFESLLQRTLE